MTQLFVTVKGRVVAFVLWQRSSLAPFRIHNRSASSRNHHRTYDVTRRVFARSPLRAFTAKCELLHRVGGIKAVGAVTHAVGDKSGRRYRLLARTSRYRVIPIRTISALIPSHNAVHIRDYTRVHLLAQSWRGNQSRPQRVPGQGWHRYSCLLSYRTDERTRFQFAKPRGY